MPPLAGSRIKTYIDAYGRPYYHNPDTGHTTYEKPEELMLEEEKDLLRCAVKEFTHLESGRKYYVDSRTKKTTWVMPEEYKILKELCDQALAKKEQDEKEALEFQQKYGKKRPNEPSYADAYLNTSVEFATYEEAEKAFCEMLTENGVRPGMEWPEAMRKVIDKPMYKALKSTAERKNAFEAYIARESERESEEKKERETRQHQAFIQLLKKTKEIKHYSRFSTAAKLFSGTEEFTQLEPRQQQDYFEEYVSELRRKEHEHQKKVREDSLARFNTLLQSLPDITFKTTWDEAQGLYKKGSEFQSANPFEGMEKVDFLTSFELHSLSLWKEPESELLAMKRARKRRERNARDGFKSLLKELHEQQRLNGRTLWKDIYPCLSEDPRYLGMLGLSGSTPLDLFFDLKDELMEEMNEQEDEVKHVLKKYEFEVKGDTTLEAYRQVLDQDEKVTKKVTAENAKLIFEHLQAKAQRYDLRKREKELHKKMDTLRYAMKDLDPPVSVEDTWDTIRPRVEALPAFQDLDDEPSRVAAFEKLIRRLKEKQGGQDEEEEEGMIMEDEEHGRRHRSRSRSEKRSRHSSSRHSGRRDSDRESDRGHESADARKRRKRSESRPIEHDRRRTGTDDGDALDEYEKFSRRAR